MTKTTEERFWAKVDRREPDECWPWVASRHKHGHGYFYDGTKVVYAHRFMWSLENGQIPDGLCICHRCDNGWCCNPNHLWIGTHQDNMKDMGAKGRQFFQKHPERVPRGDNHPWRLNPELVPRGKRNGRFTKPERTARGERHGSAKLTESAVREIREAKGSHRAVGKTFGVSEVQIGKIRHRKAWAHVGP